MISFLVLALAVLGARAEQQSANCGTSAVPPTRMPASSAFLLAAEEIYFMRKGWTQFSNFLLLSILQRFLALLADLKLKNSMKAKHLSNVLVVV